MQRNPYTVRFDTPAIVRLASLTVSLCLVCCCLAHGQVHAAAGKLVRDAFFAFCFEQGFEGALQPDAVAAEASRADSEVELRIGSEVDLDLLWGLARIRAAPVVAYRSSRRTDDTEPAFVASAASCEASFGPKARPESTTRAAVPHAPRTRVETTRRSARKLYGTHRVDTYTVPLRVRTGPSRDYAVSTSLAPLTRVTIVERSGKREIIAGDRGEWVVVRTADGTEGYVFGYYLTAL